MSHNFFYFFFTTLTLSIQGETIQGQNTLYQSVNMFFLCCKAVISTWQDRGLTPFGGSLQWHQEELQLA